ncbi:MAG TPA: Ig-like domain-containing protein [Gaiellaceae bacterium]|nr:Ig-like domain-containing protein [Gaiellaceae bacterium]
MDLVTPSADGVVRPKGRHARRFAVVLSVVVALAAGGAHAALADGVALTLSPNPAPSGAQVTMTATVTSTLGLPTGSVSFVDDSTGITLAVQPLTQTAPNTTTASFQISTMPTGSSTIEADYNPDLTAFLLQIGALASQTQTLMITSTPPPTKYATVVSLQAPASVSSTQPVSLIATVTRTGGVSGTPSGEVDFVDIETNPNVALGSKMLNSSGVAELDLPNLAAGPHRIIAEYAGDATDQGATSAASSVQSNEPTNSMLTTVTSVTATPAAIAQGDTVTFVATITQVVPAGQTAPATPGGIVTFTSNSDACGNQVHLGDATLGTGPAGVTVAANQAAIQLSTLQSCDYTIIASYTGDVFDDSSQGQVQLSVGGTRAATTLTYTGATSVEYGHTATFSAVLTDLHGVPVAGKTAAFTLGAQQCTGTTNANGVASCSLAVTDDVPGGNLHVAVPQDVQISGGTLDLNFTVSKQPTTLTTGYQLGAAQTTLTGTLHGDLGALANQTVTLSLGGASCSGSTDSTGVASCTVPTPTGATTATLSGSFAGAVDYLPSVAAGTTVQLVAPTSLTYNGATTAVYRGTATLAATLSIGAGGPAASGHTLTFTLGTQTCTGVTDASGEASCTLSPVTEDAGPYTVSVAYAGDAVTVHSGTSAAFTVTPAPTTTTLSAPALGSGTTTLSATLTSSGTALANKPMTLSLGGNTCPATTNANGVATCSVTTPSVANATFTATFAGDVDYATSTASTTVSLLLPTTLTYTGSTGADYDDVALLSATLRGANNKPLVLQKVTFTMGSQSCVGITDLWGNAFCVIVVSQPSGPYQVTASYAGNSTNAASTTSSPFTVTPEETTLVAGSADDVLTGSTTPLTGTLLEDGVKPVAGRMLTLSFGAQSCLAVTNAAGLATCNVVATGTLGPVSATASFAGDAYYAPASGSTQSLLYAYAPGGGSFVIGDKSTGGTVTFWGSQWSKLNALSSSSAPSSFKGYALHPTAPACGVTWSTDPGNSSPPPSGPLPAYMAVIVTSSADKSGSTISGNTVAVVVVKTNSGYDSNPGHAGTGTVVATICSTSNTSGGRNDGGGDQHGCGGH